ncbi:unnamed protein product [Ixodes pacificus]
MLLTLVLIVQMCSTIHGYKDRECRFIGRGIVNLCFVNAIRRSCHHAMPSGLKEQSERLVAAGFPGTLLLSVQLLQSGEYSPLTITGKCYNATCMRPELAPMPTKPELFCSPPETTLYKEENIATKCTQFCFDKTSPRLTYERKRYNVTNGVKCLGEKDRKVKTCQNGTCSGEYKEDDCKRKMLAVYSRTNVVETCTLKCQNNSNIQVENGAMCALRTPTRSIWSFFWGAETFVEEIGICHNGTCVHRGKYDKKYNSQEASSNGCQGTDIVINKNLTVASPCTVLCQNGTTMPRNENALCLYQFFRENKHDIYQVGKCHCGICEPRDDYFVVTSRGNPNDYKEPVQPTC